MIFGIKLWKAGSFNAAISAQNSLLRVGGLIVDRKEVMFGKIDQMSREEVENRLESLLGQAIEAQVIGDNALENDVVESSKSEVEQ